MTVVVGRERRPSGGQGLSQSARHRPTSRSARTLSTCDDDIESAMAEALVSFSVMFFVEGQLFVICSKWLTFEVLVSRSDVTGLSSGDAT